MYKLIETAHIKVYGEPSVGLNHVYINLTELGLDYQDDKETLEFYRKNLVDCFSALYDGKAQVVFDFEIPDDFPVDLI